MMIIVLLLVAAASAILTWLVGWWAILAVGLVAGAMRQRPAFVALGAALGWVAVLVVDARHGRLGALASVLGGVFHVPGFAMLLLTLLFASLGAWSAATIGEAIARRTTVTALRRRT